jgi:hypothetical protein
MRKKNFIVNHIGKSKTLQFIKKWTYEHNENNIVKDLMKAFLNSHWIGIESHLQIIICQFKQKEICLFLIYS